MDQPSHLNQSRRPLTVRISLFLILAISLVWLAFGGLVAAGIHPSYRQAGFFRWALAGLTFLGGLAMIGLWFLLNRHWKPAWYISVLLLAAMTLAGIFDDIGWIDLLVMLASAVPLVLLIKDRSWYFE